MCISHCKFSVIFNPRSFSNSTDGNNFPSIKESSLGLFFPIWSTLHFPSSTLNFKSHCFCHWLSFSISHGTSDKFQVICKVRSKALQTIWQVVYKYKEEQGPRTVPWGTTDETLKYLEYVDPTLT